MSLLIHVADGEQPALSAQCSPVLSLPAATGHPGDIEGGGLWSLFLTSMVAFPQGSVLTLTLSCLPDVLL